MRQATLSDIPDLVEMGHRFHEAKQKKYRFCSKSTEEFFASMIANGIVLKTDDGFLVGVAAPEPSNRQYLVAHEVFWWSEGRSGLKLRKAFEEWAKEIGCSEIQFSHPEDEKLVEKLLDRAGYRPATRIWAKPCV